MKTRDKIELKDTNSLIPYPKNNKRHPQSQIDLLAKNITEFGFTQPILIDKTDTIIAGHARHQASTQLGLKTIPTILIDDLTEEQIKALRISDNRLAELSETDWTNLKLEYDELKNSKFDVDLLGYSDDDFKDMFENPEPPENKVSFVVKNLCCPNCKHKGKKGEFKLEDDE